MGPPFGDGATTACSVRFNGIPKPILGAILGAKEHALEHVEKEPIGRHHIGRLRSIGPHGEVLVPVAPIHTHRLEEREASEKATL